MKSKPKFSPEKYIKEKARTLPIYECLVSQNEDEYTLTTAVVSRLQPSGKITFGVYLIDMFCLGIKDAFCNCNFSLEQFEEVKERASAYGILMPEDPVYVHNLIYGAVDYANELGFTPSKSFALPEYILDPDLVDDGIDDIEFGKDGMPYFICGPFDNANMVIATLDRNVGPGNYHFISGL
jgi:hypothetical protein